MDLKGYYRKVRKVESEIPEAEVVVVSEETNDGGKAGVMTEVQRAIAARLVVDGRARLATAEETEQFREETLRKKKEAEHEARLSKMQLTLAPGEVEKLSLKERE